MADISKIKLPDGTTYNLKDTTKLEKITNEWNREIAFGSSGILKIGAFPVYDTNITVEIQTTTNCTYNGILIIAAQNNVIQQASVYGDYADTIGSNLFIKPSSTSDKIVEIYFKPPSYSKNLIHIRCLAPASRIDTSTLIQNVSAVPSTATLKPTNLSAKINDDTKINSLFTLI